MVLNHAGIEPLLCTVETRLDFKTHHYLLIRVTLAKNVDRTLVDLNDATKPLECEILYAQQARNRIPKPPVSAPLVLDSPNVEPKKDIEEISELVDVERLQPAKDLCAVVDGVAHQANSKPLLYFHKEEGTGENKKVVVYRTLKGNLCATLLRFEKGTWLQYVPGGMAIANTLNDLKGADVHKRVTDALLDANNYATLVGVNAWKKMVTALLAESEITPRAIQKIIIQHLTNSTQDNVNTENIAPILSQALGTVLALKAKILNISSQKQVRLINQLNTGTVEVVRPPTTAVGRFCQTLTSSIKNCFNKRQEADVIQLGQQDLELEMTELDSTRVMLNLGGASNSLLG